MSGNGQRSRDRTRLEGRRNQLPSRRTGSNGADSPVKVVAASDGTPKGDEAIEAQDLDLDQGSWASEAISSCGAGEGRDTETPRSSQLRCNHCADLVHQLSNTMTAVLMNAQLLEWKLPPYSRLKRPVLEVERNAQRGAELLKRLRQQFGKNASPPEAAAGQWRRAGALTAVTAQEPAAGAATAPGFSTEPAELTVDCDPCTSSFFPKGDDGNER
jgi:hypothetical protein